MRSSHAHRLRNAFSSALYREPSPGKCLSILPPVDRIIFFLEAITPRGCSSAWNPGIELTQRGWAYLSDPKGHGWPVYSLETLLFWPHKAKHLQVARPGVPVGHAQAPPQEIPPHSDSAHTCPGVFPGPPPTCLSPSKPRPRSAICCPESAPRLSPGCAASCSDTVRACCLPEATLQPAFLLGHNPKVLCRVASLWPRSQELSYPSSSRHSTQPLTPHPSDLVKTCSMQLLQHLLEFCCGQEELFNQATHSLGLPAVFL